MRVALISDSHGNATALRAVLADLAYHPTDQIVHLGDAIQGGGEPKEVIDILKELGCPVIQGNADYFVLSGATAETVGSETHEVSAWTREQLGRDGLSFVESFLTTLEVDLGSGKTLLCFHGSPNSFNDVILPETPDEAVEKLLDTEKATVFSGGHTHLQWTRRVRDSTYLNPGSVGLAYNRHLPMEKFYVYPIAEYAIVHSNEDQVSIEFCRVPFDGAEVAKAALKNGRPHADRELKRFSPPDS